MQQPAQAALGHCCNAMAWVIAGATGEQPGARLNATRSRQVIACSLCCMAVACNGAALRQGVVTGSLLTVTTPVARLSDLSTP